MARIKLNVHMLSVLTLLVFLLTESKAKISDNRTNNAETLEIKPTNKNDGAALLFADELKHTIERYLFGICPQTFKVPLSKKNLTAPACDLDTEQQDLAGRFATLSLRAQSAARGDCARLGAALAGALGELARSAAARHGAAGTGACCIQQFNTKLATRYVATVAANEAIKKRKLSKSQKKQIIAKQKTALAVKKKAAAAAAAAAAKMAS